ncbi:MAG: elongation factor P [Alphaproteobacteria bacterium]|jgi:elongation factor P|tara:strand:- start:40572 stop:41135 length:564 start_codon:yes stop_codon:yes gene_type:complete
MKVNGNQVFPGNIIEYKNSLWSVIKAQAVKPGKGGAFNQVELKSIIGNTKLNERFRSDDSIELVRIESYEFQYLYSNDGKVVFMNKDNFEQIELDEEFIGERKSYLQDGMNVQIELYEEKPIGIIFPKQLTLKIKDTEPTIKGQTASSSYKPAILENDLRVMVPPFVSVGDSIIVDTNDSSYIKRAD